MMTINEQIDAMRYENVIDAETIDELRETRDALDHARDFMLIDDYASIDDTLRRIDNAIASFERDVRNNERKIEELSAMIEA